MPFSESYFVARERFVEAAKQVGTCQEVPITANGPSGEPVGIDLAQTGADNPERMVVLSSGLHSVEGFYGSAV